MKNQTSPITGAASTGFAPASVSNGSRVALMMGAALSATMLAGLVAAPGTAFAADECGVQAGPTVTCTPAGNPYPVGIEYVPTADLTIIVNTGVVVNSVADGVLISGTGLDFDGTINTAAGSSVTAVGTGEGVYVDDANATIVNNSTIVAGRTGLITTVGGVGDASITNNASVTVNGSSVNYGIFASAPQGHTTIVNSGAVNVTTTGIIGGGIYVSNDYSPDLLTDTGVDVTSSGNITVSAVNGYAIGIGVTADGPVNISANDITTSGQYAWGIVVRETKVNPVVVSFDDISVSQTGGAILGGGDGVFIYAASGAPVTVTGDTVAITGDYGDGIFIGGGGGIAGNTAVTINSVSTNGLNSDGIDIGANGNITVNSGAISTAGANSRGMELTTTAAGNITVTSGSVTTTGVGSQGIYADAVGGNVFVTTNGPTTTTASAVVVHSDTGSVTANNNGVITASGPGTVNGIDASAPLGHVTVSNTSTINATSTTGNASGIYVGNDFPDVLADTGVNITGLGTINVSAVNGYATGISVVADGPVVINTGDINSSGLYAWGIAVLETRVNPVSVTFDDIVVNQTGGLILGGGDGVNVYAASGAPVTVIGDTIAITGAYADGVFIGGSGGIAGNTVVNVNSITTNGLNSDGIDVGGNGTIAITAGSIATQGVDSRAVEATNTTGAITIAVTSASTTGAGADGLYALSVSGPITVTGTGTLSTTGANANAIDITTTGAATVNRTGSITTTGAGSDAVLVRGGTAAVTVGSVNATGTTAEALNVLSTVGAANATVTGAVNSAQSDAIRIVGATTASVTVASGGSVTSSGLDSIDITSVTGSTVTNSGTITRGAGGFAIDANGGAATVNNNASGVINGAMDLTANNDTVTNAGTINQSGTSAFGLGNDTVNNSGTYNLAGTIDFGAGADNFNNTGTVRVTTGTGTILGLENFNNNGGLVDLRDGAANDTLTMPLAVFNGTGASRLGLDVNFATAVADMLLIGDATGNTSIIVNDLGTTGTLGERINLVDASGDMTGSEFSLQGGEIDHGFVAFTLQFDAATDTFYLLGNADDEVFQMGRAGAAAQSFWNHGVYTWSARMQEVRDVAGSGAPGRSEGWEMWAQAHAGGEKRGGDQTFTAFGSTIVTNGRTESDWRGFQMGADTLTSGGMLLGVTGGFVQQETAFNSSGGNSFDIEGWNAGAYAGLNAGAFFLNGQVNGAWYDIDANLHSIPFMAHMSGSTWGAKAETGFRFGGSGFWVEPIASLAWSRTTIDGFDAPGAAFDFDNNDGLLGQAGVRIGGTMGSISPFVGVYAVKEFQGENGVTVTTGPTAFSFQDTPQDTFGKVDFGFNILGWNGLEGFVKGEADFGNNASGVTGRLGVRWRW